MGIVVQMFYIFKEFLSHVTLFGKQEHGGWKQALASLLPAKVGLFRCKATIMNVH